MTEGGKGSYVSYNKVVSTWFSPRINVLTKYFNPYRKINKTKNEYKNKISVVHRIIVRCFPRPWCYSIFLFQKYTVAESYYAFPVS